MKGRIFKVLKNIIDHKSSMALNVSNYMFLIFHIYLLSSFAILLKG